MGVYLSRMLDLESLYGTSLRERAPHIRFLPPDKIERPEDVRFALAWDPDPDAFDRFPNIRLVSSIGAGASGILKCPSLPPDIAVVRVSNKEQARAMAGFAVWHVLWHHRQFAQYQGQKRERRWKRISIKSPSEIGIGILGFGNMGRATAEALAHLGYRVTALARDGAAERPPAPPGIQLVTGKGALHEVAATSEILINLLPLTPETHGILSSPLFERMPRGSYLVQLGRGEHLSEPDLLHALATGRLAGASIDVFSQEPLRHDHPFWSQPDIFITPHVASEASPAAVASCVLAEVERFLAGLAPLNPVKPDRGY